MPTEKLVDL